MSTSGTLLPKAEGGQPDGIVRVFDELPELIHGLSPIEAAEARRVPARTLSLPPGPWVPNTTGPPGHLGLLVLDGLLSRAVSVAPGTPFSELLGTADLLRPWQGAGSQSDSVRAEVVWEVLHPTRLAVLDRRFALAIARWPEVTGAIIDRAVDRSRSLVFQLAVCHLKRIEGRVLAALWHAADRWGRVTRDGVVVSLPLTHKLLASMVGAHRPSVTTALGALRKSGAVERRADGAWVLLGAPPREFANLQTATWLSPMRG